VYRDPDTSREDQGLLALLLSYMATPPHLKKKLFPIDERLRYAGLLPPLRTPSHEPPVEPRPGAILDGYVEECSGGRCRVNLGLLGEAVLEGSTAKPGSVVTVRIVSVAGGRVLVERASWGDIYPGFRVSMAGRLEGVVSRYRKRGYGILATSRYGECLVDEEAKQRVARMARRPLLVVFGGPRLGVLEYASRSLFDATVNFIPWQGVETVRTEEALHAVLALLNALTPSP